MMKKVLVLCTTDSMIWNFLVPHIKALQERGYTVECACARTGDYIDWLRDKWNLTVHCIPFERNPFRTANVKAYLSLKKLVMEQGFGIIFCHEPVGGAMGRLVGAKCGCKVIYMAHGFHFFKGCSKAMYLFYFVERYLARKTDYLLTLNQEDYEASLEFKAKHKLKTNGIGIDLSKFKPVEDSRLLRQELHLKPDDFVILSVGELIHRKNHESLIRAVAAVSSPAVHYAVAGEGELLDYLTGLVKELGLEAQVHLLGYRKDVAALCNSCDAFALPSYQEGLSMALMESMACGKPVIASRIRGNTDLIADGAGGVLVDPEDVPGYAAAIKKLMDDPVIREKYGNYNAKKVKDYSLEKVIPQIMSVFDSIEKEA